MANDYTRSMRDPRNQPEGRNDQDKHGRKQNLGSNQQTPGKSGSSRDEGSDDRRSGSQSGKS
ncbi:MAG: hypothetical protein LC715_02320 [Gammaproteobacteria bacterium]|nr:hypothetical protein [Gammaproteobacteria bacterium]